MELLSVTDQLTDVYNRRAFEVYFKLEQERAIRYENDLSLILLDIDYFKNINDKYGHQTGDKILKQIVKVLKKQKRKNDYLCRWGGDEFVFLLPETSLIKAQVIAERFRSSIEMLQPVGQTKITVSMGLAKYNQGDTLKTLLKRADVALYRAKDSGRNCFKVFSSPVK